jgi:hypothetical protein
MLARRMPGILPPLTMEERIEVTKIHSASGEGNGALVTRRPFRAPHHTVSTSGLAGGGSNPRPGEVSLAHHGVLFLDELPEFSRTALEALRQPLEDGHVTISRSRDAELSCVGYAPLFYEPMPLRLRRGQEEGLPVHCGPDRTLPGPNLGSFARSDGPLRRRAAPYAPGVARRETGRRVQVREGAG